jgi:tetratricopeptide (TPR) repeat protein
MRDNSLMKKGYIPRLMSSEALGGYASRLKSLKASGVAAAVFQRRWAGPAVAAGVALVSFLLLGYGVWLLQLERGARALAHGDLDKASELYTSAERPFHSVLARAFPEHYSRAVFPKIAILYNRGKTSDAVIELERATARAPSLAERPEFAFWSGNILLRRALEATDSEIIIKHLYAAAAHFRKALEASPDDWDIKYNYELVQYVLAEQEREKEKEQSKMKSILDRIRTITEPAPKEPPPPEKQG